MPKILKVNTPGDYSSYLGLRDRHPLVSVIEYSRISPIRHSLNSYGVYGIFLQEDNDNDLIYGCGKYDFRNGSLICVAPGQIGGKEENGERVSIGGWAMLFHPDLLRGTSLQSDIRGYSFFDYRINEALHMNRDEYRTVVSLLRKMEEEIGRPRDDFQDEILVEYISLLLKFCKRFYNRQFQTRKPANADILIRFEELLHGYYSENRQLKEGIPTVAFCADRLCMSTNYFSDLIKKTTGENASTLIRRFVIGQAKNGLASGMTVAETAYKLGFEYPQHLSRLFKKGTGMTPREYLKYLTDKAQEDNGTARPPY